ncbi:S8 family serine peptidase [Micromonospora marina]|uniref:S8 family serine peptidase n=1 Tax=Micromonospora marina TaxID=307120 RepID=UPI0034563DE2
MSRTPVFPAVAALAAVVGVVAPAPPALARSELPELDNPSQGCVGPSPVVATEQAWPFRRLAPSTVWPLSRGRGIVVAVLDTGVSATAPALAGAVRPGVDVVNGGPADSDCQGRGTALAGLVAARPRAGTPIAGIAPDATVLPVRIVDAEGRVPDGALAAGLRAATRARADVILVGTGTARPDPALRAAVRAAVAADVVVVAPINGQRAESADRPAAVWYPAAYPEVVAVGGIGPDGTPLGSPAPAAGVDLAAPGTEAVAAGPVGVGHFRVGGTAVAAAQVAATAALVRGYRRDESAATVVGRLVRTAEPPADPALAALLGAGLVDVREAVGATVLGVAPRNDLPEAAVTPPEVPPRPPAAALAVTVSLACLGTAALAGLVAATLRRGRRRGWRP